ncbi:MAG: hypothetical protein KC457_20390 [Myxococcales bacterium]|nr:hypothetical protein [Myxococcales bacterium]
MILHALFDPLAVLVLSLVLAAIAGAGLWWWRGRQAGERLHGGLTVLRRVAGELPSSHPIRRRLEAAPVGELSFEEIAHLLHGEAGAPARALLQLEQRISWIERFAQFAVHLGILGTVFALVASDPTDLEAFRASLPIALGTTFWGLCGALALSAIAGGCESVGEQARTRVREALLEGLTGGQEQEREHGPTS